MKVTEINIYPIKSMKGISQKEAFAEKIGLKHDRRMMLVDDQGLFVSQRKLPELALINCSLRNDLLVVSTSKDDLSIPLNFDHSRKSSEVTVWDDTLKAQVFPDSINNWFSDYLNKKVSLVKYGVESIRLKTFNKNPKQSPVSFADGYPYLMLGTASMKNLNNKLSVPLNINRFRANIIVDTTVAHEEDSFEDINIGSAIFKNIKTCKRCIMITIDQKTAIKGTEPLKTLSTYRKLDNYIHFGTNLICMKEGKISVGDEVRHLDF